MINWDHIPEVIEAIRNLVLTAAGGVGIYVALQGLSSWKAQETWKEDRELAKSVLSAVYETRTQIANFRRPLMTSGEMASAMDDQEVDFRDENIRKVAKQKAWGARYTAIVDAYKPLETLETEAEVVWGNELAKDLKDLRSQILELKLALEESPMFRESWDRPDPDVQKENRAVLYGRSKNDRFGEKVDVIVGRIAVYARRYLGRPS